MIFEKSKSPLLEFCRQTNLKKGFFIEKAINTDSCKGFLDKYLAGVNLMDVFNKARGQRGFAYNPISTAKEYANGLALGSIQGTNGNDRGGGIDFSANFQGTQINSGGGGSLFNVTQAAEFVSTFIHELIHISANSRDDVGMEKLLRNGGENMGLPEKYVKSQYTASMSWGPVLEKNCGVTPEMILGWLNE